jgi:hypothetical protein
MENGAGPMPESAEWGAFMKGYADANKAFVAAGVMRGGQTLLHRSTATSVRLRNGKTETMDGSFAETRERLGGYCLPDCRDLAQAIEINSFIPTVRHGTRT